MIQEVKTNRPSEAKKVKRFVTEQQQLIRAVIG